MRPVDHTDEVDDTIAAFLLLEAVKLNDYAHRRATPELKVRRAAPISEPDVEPTAHDAVEEEETISDFFPHLDNRNEVVQAVYGIPKEAVTDCTCIDCNIYGAGQRVSYHAPLTHLIGDSSMHCDVRALVKFYEAAKPLGISF